MIVARAAQKTVRFTRVVERSGQPRVHTLWLPPEKDPEFKRAREAHRVMTVEPGGSGKTDVGIVGFDAAHDKGGQFLIFPKSLEPFADARVVGIKFDLIAQPKSVPAAPEPRSAAQAKRKPRPHPNPSPAAKTTARAQVGAASARKENTLPTGDGDNEGTPATSEAASRPPETSLPLPAAERTASPSSAKTHAAARVKGPPLSTRRDSREATAANRGETALLRAVHAAMKDLQAGKAVAAYQRLERAVADAERD